MNINAYVVSKLKNVHETQSWIWSVSLAAVLIISAEDLVNGFLRASISQQSIFDTFFLENIFFNILLYFLYLVVVYRFFVGENRILDHYYVSVPQTLINDDINLKIYLKCFRRRDMVIDGIARTIQYSLLVSIGLALFDPTSIYQELFMCLLLFNALYCLVNLQINTSPENTIDLLIETEKHFKKFRRIWALNNLICLLAIYVTYASNFEGSLKSLCFISVLYLNSAIDIFLCRRLYAPRYIDMIRQYKSC